MTLESKITLAIAILGAVLGVVNTYYAFFKDKEKIKVSLGYTGIYISNGPLKNFKPSVMVVNASSFPVYVAYIFLSAPDEFRWEPFAKVRSLGMTMRCSDKVFPYKIEPRASAIFDFPLGLERWPNLKHMYATVTLATGHEYKAKLDKFQRNFKV